jgi:hypothetical protein
LSVGYRGTAKLTWSAFSQAVWVLATGGPRAFLVSPFNVKWRFSVPAGGVEGSKLCLFSVIMPAKCVSSVSPRFHYRRVTFCFLPLAAILESPREWSFSQVSIDGLNGRIVDKHMIFGGSHQKSMFWWTSPVWEWVQVKCVIQPLSWQ